MDRHGEKKSAAQHASVGDASRRTRATLFECVCTFAMLPYASRVARFVVVVAVFVVVDVVVASCIFAVVFAVSAVFQILVVCFFFRVAIVPCEWLVGFAYAHAPVGFRNQPLTVRPR